MSIEELVRRARSRGAAVIEGSVASIRFLRETDGEILEEARFEAPLVHALTESLARSAGVGTAEGTFRRRVVIDDKPVMIQGVLSDGSDIFTIWLEVEFATHLAQSDEEFDAVFDALNEMRRSGRLTEEALRNLKPLLHRHVQARSSLSAFDLDRWVRQTLDLLRANGVIKADDPSW